MNAFLPLQPCSLPEGDTTQLLRPAKLAFVGPICSSKSEAQDYVSTQDASNLLSVVNCEPLVPKTNVEFGNYRFIKSLGSGGFGDVWLAEQLRPMRREVALKAIRRGAVTRITRQRFEREKQALAIMEHENIAKIYEASCSEDTQFFAMEYVRGLSITQYARAKNLTLRQRIELFIPVCRAVHHAHQKRVLHRDLKPANILVTEHDGVAVPKVIDFGIAKPLGDLPCMMETDKDDMPVTLPGYCLGTPQYMSPEQAMGLADLDVTSDIYSLGIILFELLVGEPPLTKADLDGLAPYQQMERIINNEATPPSTLWLGASTTNQKRCFDRTLGDNPKRISHLLRGDLDGIVQKALEKTPSHRYPTAETLADDLAAHLCGKPVSVNAHGKLRLRWQKHVTKHRFAMLTSSLALFALVCCAFAFGQWQRAEAACAMARHIQEQAAQTRVADSRNSSLTVLDQMAPTLMRGYPRKRSGAKPTTLALLRTLGSINSLDDMNASRPARQITLAGK